MDRVAEYLCIPSDYLRWLNVHARVPPAGDLGELHWSMSGDAIEYATGATFAFSPEIAQFVEGLGTSRRLPHFGYVVHLLHILRQSGNQEPVEFAALSQAFVKAGKPLRNAGTLSGLLTAEVPPTEEPIDTDAVCRQLASFALMSDLCARWALRRRKVTVPKPPLGPAAFEAVLLKALAGVRPEDLEHWFRHGRGPLDREGRRLAEEVAAVKPRSLEGVLAALAQRERFAGAMPFVPQLVSALTLPPRRLAQRELPLGGYADLATRGHPEQILPSQFALEDLEFLRRFAEHELLFFRREEPPSQTREELVVLLDQGVRTWGDVRLVLRAAVLAFGKAAVRRRIPFRVAATASGGRVVNPLEVEDQALGEMLEASDLSPHPSLALERVLEEPAPAGRDIVLLTHPRNLVEADVAGAARRVGPGTRLFGVGVDGHGAVQFAELKHGTPVKVCQFHIDLTRSAPLGPETVEQPGSLEPLTPWHGDVEPIGFPFCFGLMSHLKRFDFDQAGDWLLVAGQHGMLYAWKTDGTRMEVLPRGLRSPTVLTDVEYLVGVAGGFVVGGVIDDRLTAFHYDWTRRTVTAYPMDFAREHGPFHWRYSHEHHALTVVSTGLLCTDLAVYCRGVDLATAERFPPAKGSATGASRVAEACAAAPQHAWPAPYLMITTDPPTSWQHPGLYLNHDAGTIQPRGVDQEWRPFRPVSEGRSLLKDQRLLWGVCRADMLALVTFDNQQRQTLRLFRGPDGITLGEHPTHGHVALSSDGRLVASSRGPSQVSVRPTDGGTVPLLVTVKGHAHPRIDIRLARRLLVVRVGRRGHLFNWHQEELQITPLTNESRSNTPKVVRVLHTCGKRATNADLPDWVRYDPRRFVQAARGDVVVVSDSFGQLTVFDTSGKLVCMFFVFRDQAGAWMPDGTRYGPASVTGGPPTPGALRKLGRALREAGERHGRSVP